MYCLYQKTFPAVIVACLIPLWLCGQWNSPTVDGIAGNGEYGDHVENRNMLTSTTSCSGNNAKWYLCWDGINIYLAFKNCFDASGSGNDAINVYLDIDNYTPVNGGPGTDTTIAFDNMQPLLPFHADFFAYAKVGYNAWRRFEEDWTGADHELPVSISGSGSGKTIEMSIPWDIVTNGNGIPDEFNFIAYASYDCGTYAAVPLINSPSLTCGLYSSAVRYYNVSSTSINNSTWPFSQECYTHRGGNIMNFGAIDIFDLTMNTPGATISRSIGDWNIAGILRIHSGTVDFSNTQGSCDINGKCIIGSEGSLKLSSVIGGDIIIGGDLYVEGSLNTNNRSVTFDGNSANTSQTIYADSQLHFDYVKLANPLHVDLAADIYIHDDLEFQDGCIILNAYDLLMGDSATFSGLPGAGKMIVTNSSGKYVIATKKTGYYVFPVGDNTVVAEYSPVEFKIDTIDPGQEPQVGIRVVNSKHPLNPSNINYIDRYWSISIDDINSINVQLSAFYTDADINGDENSIFSMKYNTGWSVYSNVSADFNILEFKNITGFSDITGGDLLALPVELVSFKAEESRDGSVLLSWITASEANCDFFEIERSRNGKEFINILRVNGSGDKSTETTYNLIDHYPWELNYYRLRQVDYNGNHSYSKVIAVEISTTPGFRISSFSVENKILLQIESDEDSKSLLQLFDLRGREMYRNEITLNKGINHISIDRIHPSSRLYFIQIASKRGQSISKVIH